MDHCPEKSREPEKLSKKQQGTGNIGPSPYQSPNDNDSDLPHILLLVTFCRFGHTSYIDVKLRMKKSLLSFRFHVITLPHTQRTQEFYARTEFVCEKVFIESLRKF